MIDTLMVQCIFVRVIKNDSSLGTVDSTRGRIYSVIKKLKANGFSGPDGFLLLLFNNRASSLFEYVSPMFKLFLFIGQIPREHAVVTLVCKN